MGRSSPFLLLLLLMTWAGGCLSCVWDSRTRDKISHPPLSSSNLIPGGNTIQSCNFPSYFSNFRARPCAVRAYVPFNILPATSLPPPASLLFFFPCSLPPSSGGCGFPPPSPLSSLSPPRRNLISQSVSPSPSPFFSSLSLLRRQLFLLLLSSFPPRQGTGA